MFASLIGRRRLYPSQVCGELLKQSLGSYFFPSFSCHQSSDTMKPFRQQSGATINARTTRNSNRRGITLQPCNEHTVIRENVVFKMYQYFFLSYGNAGALFSLVLLCVVIGDGEVPGTTQFRDDCPSLRRALI